MKLPKSLFAFLASAIILSCIGQAQALTLQIHATSEKSGAQGNLLSFVAQHTGNLPSGSNVFFYVVNAQGVTENVGRQESFIGGLWTAFWIAKAPGTYQLYAVLRNGVFESSTELVRSQPVEVIITGKSLSIHATTEKAGAQGNLLSFVAAHNGNLPSGANVFFYVVNSQGVTENVGRQESLIGGLWTNSWIAKAPGNYQLYAVLRTGVFESSPEVARTNPVNVTITGRAISMHPTTEKVGAQGNLLQLVTAHNGKLPSGSNVFFYVVNSQGVTEVLGRQESLVGGLYTNFWIAKAPGIYQVYSVLRTGVFESSEEVARTQPVNLSITGSAIFMHSSTNPTALAGRTGLVVAATTGQLPGNANVFFYAVNRGTGVTTQLGRASSPVGQLWSSEWTPVATANYFIYAVLRDGVFESSDEIARTGDFQIFAHGTRIPLPFERVAGTYHALLSGDARPLLSVQITPNGRFTARILLYGLTYVFRGEFAADGTAVVRSDMRNRPSLQVQFFVDSTSGNVSGRYQLAEGTPVAFALFPLAHSGRPGDVSPLAGRAANALFSPNPGSSANPVGHGFARVTFLPNGSCRLVGRMPDGKRLTTVLPGLNSGVQDEILYPAYVIWRGRVPSTLQGTLAASFSAFGAPGSDVMDIEGLLEWHMPPDSSRTILPSEVRVDLEFYGAIWSQPRGVNALDATTNSVRFQLVFDPESEVLFEALQLGGEWGPNNRPTLTLASVPATFTYAQRTGQFSGRVPGSAAQSASLRPFTYQGMMLSFPTLTPDGRLLHGAGFLLGNGKSVPVEIFSED